MLRTLASWWRDPVREGRGLERDARLVTEGPMATHDAARIAALRDALLERLAELDAITSADSGGDEAAASRLELRYRALNREARKRSDWDASTVLTLAIIELRAARLGDHGDPARARVRAAFADAPPVARQF